MTALAAKAGLSQARDFALGVLTERVRQEEDGWPDQAGDGKRTAHGTGNSHACLLETKHHVENALYAIGTPELRRSNLGIIDQAVFRDGSSAVTGKFRIFNLSPPTGRHIAAESACRLIND